MNVTTTDHLCEDCGTDISHRRSDAILCVDCRKQSNRDLAALHYSKNKDHCLRNIKARWDSFTDEEKRLIRRRAARLYKFNMTLDQYDAKFIAQGGVCAICKQPETHTYKGRITELVVDHDRACCKGKRSCGHCIRDLLCHKCNAGLGMFNDNPDSMRAAIEYVKTHTKRIFG